MAESGYSGVAGGCGGFPCPFVRGYEVRTCGVECLWSSALYHSWNRHLLTVLSSQLVCDTCKESDDHAEGYPTCEENSGCVGWFGLSRESVDFALTVLLVRVFAQRRLGGG